MSGSPEHDQLQASKRIDSLCDRFEKSWRRNASPRIEDYLLEAPEEDRSTLFEELLANEIELRTKRGDTPSESEYLSRFPRHAKAVHELFSDSRATEFFEQLREYKLEHKLGEGGMGEVYKAIHTRLKRPVAVKILPAEKMHNPQTVARFQREMEAVGRLDDPHIVRAHDAGEVSGTHYLVMEYVDGFDLDELQRRVGRLTIPDACEIIRQAATGLQSASELGLVHRDIKPSNLMLTRSGEVKILDLGLAQTDGADEPSQDLTSTGQVMGTCDYIAPEQATDTKSVDIRADIYSLGCTLFKLLIGRAPFATDEYPTMFARLRAHVEAPIPSVWSERRDVPAELDLLQTRMLAKQTADRFQTPAELVEAIQPMCADHNLVRLHSKAADSAKESTLPKMHDSTVLPLSSALSDTALEQQIPNIESAEDLDEQPTFIGPNQPAIGRGRVFKLVASLLLLLAVTYGGSVVLRLKDDGGTIVLECDPAALENAKVEVDGKEVKVILGSSGKSMSIAVDQKHGKLRIRKDGFKVFAKDFEIAPNDGSHTIRVRFEPQIADPILAKNDPGRKQTSKDTRAATRKTETNASPSKPLVQSRVTAIKVELPAILPRLEENTTHKAVNWALSADASVTLYVPSSGTHRFVQPAHHKGGMTDWDDELLLESISFGAYREEQYRLVTDEVLDNLRGIKARNLRLTFRNTGLSETSIAKLQSYPAVRASLVELTVSGPQWTNESVIAAAVFPNLEGLRFEGCPQITDEAISYLRSNLQSNSLVRFSVSGSSITDNSLRDLAKMKGLKGISLEGCKNITADGLRGILTKPHSITSLDISHTGLGDEVLGDIARAGIDHLKVNGTAITDEGIKQLNNIALSHLYAEGTGLGDKAASYLSRLRLEHLVLTDTKVTDASVDDLASIGSLEYLYVGGTKLTLNGLNSLKKQLPDCRIGLGDRTLEIVKLIQSVDGEVGVFPDVGGVETRIRKDSRIPGFKFRVSEIVLGSDDPQIGRRINDRSLDSLLGLRTTPWDWVRDFTLANTSVTNEGIANVSTLPGMSSVEEVSLEGIEARPGLEDAILAMAKRWKKLKALNLDDVQLAGDAVSRLRQALPKCQINVDGKSRKVIAWLESVGGKASISFVTNEGQPASRKTVSSISDLPDAPFIITEVDPVNVTADDSRVHVDYIPVYVFRLPRLLESLTLGGARVNRACLERLASSRLQSKVPRLALHGETIVDDVLEVVARLPELKSLKLIDCGQVDDVAIQHLAMSNLTSLTIVACPQVSKVGIEKLKQALPKCDVQWGDE